MSGRLTDKVAIITGGASGIGRAAAQLFAKEGAKVVVADLNGPAAEQTTHLIEESGGQAIFVEADVSKADQVQGIFQATLERFEKLDVLVNNAGILIRTLPPHEVSEADWDLTLDSNLRSVFLCCKYAVPHMTDRGGSIVNVSSGAGVRGTVNWVPYGVSKAGIIQLTKTLCRAYAPYRIRANVIIPGWVDTPQSRASTGSTQAFESTVSSIPIGRIGAPEDVAYLMLYLASDESSYVTGASFNIDGGSSA